MAADRRPHGQVGGFKVIFLDVDGVLHPAVPSSGSGDPGHFQREPMRVLTEIVRQTDARIVLSSAWRTMPGGVAAVNKALQQCGLPKISSCTPEKGTSRVEQIWQWLNEHRAEVAGYVALDDMDLSTETDHQGLSGPSLLKDHCVKTDPEVGLSQKHISLVILTLNRGANLPRPSRSSTPQLNGCLRADRRWTGDLGGDRRLDARGSLGSGEDPRGRGMAGGGLPRLPQAAAQGSARGHREFAASRQPPKSDPWTQTPCRWSSQDSQYAQRRPQRASSVE